MVTPIIDQVRDRLKEEVSKNRNLKNENARLKNEVIAARANLAKSVKLMEKQLLELDTLRTVSYKSSDLLAVKRKIAKGVHNRLFTPNTILIFKDLGIY